MATEKEPFHINTFSKGADFDSEKEILCSQPGNGIYIDGNNCRPVSNDGNTGSNEKIKGEEILYPNNKGLAGYECIGSESVNNDLVEFWAPTSGIGPGICVVNGVVVLKSLLFELRVDFPLQWDRNEACIGGEIYITDNRVPPYLFNIKDMVDSLTLDPNKYFSAFDPLLYQVNLQSPLDRPAFIELINVGGGGGLPVGQYQYAMRYVTNEGDRTNWSATTPMIPIVQALDDDSRIFPWVKTYGGIPDPQSKTAYAIHLRFRVTNSYNYDFVEIKRIAYNQGAGLDFVPAGRIVAKIQVSPQQYSVIDYIDPAESNSDIVLSANDETQQLAEVERAKAIRYFDKRVVLMNVKLASKESALTFKEINGKQGFPVIDKMYKAGHKDPYNHTYLRSHMHGEKYGYAIGLYDGVGTKGFATRIPQLKNYEFPNRRDPIATETNDYSFGGTVRAADTTTTDVGNTHEVFDLGDPTFKSDVCSFKNIIQSGRVLGLTGSRNILKLTEFCDEDSGDIENHGVNVAILPVPGTVTCSYQPFTPVRQSDPDVTGHEYVVNTKVYSNTSVVACTVLPDDKYNYRPPGFSPDYYAQGLMIAGVDNFPKWAKAFSVVRTDAAKRVVCQGLGFYSLVQAKYKVVGTESLLGKELNKFWFYSPDIEQGIVSSDVLNDIIANPQNYAIQFVSPLGFFSEVYSFEDNLAACNRNRIVDMITYVRMIRDLQTDPNNQINPNEDGNMGVTGGDGYRYPDYDRYRNVTNAVTTFSGDAAKGNREVALAAVRRKAEGRGTFIELETIDNIYGKSGTGGVTNRNFDDAGLKDFTEPMYVINIIRTGAEVRSTNIQPFKQTSHYQKLESIIGRGTGLPGQNYLLVDERWEDCIPSMQPGQFGSTTDRYIYIKKLDGTVERWINTTYMTGAQQATIIANIISFGIYLGNSGVYHHTNIDNLNRFFRIDFFHPTIVPKDGEFILVRYDNTAPIRVYGGDTYVGETIFSPIDRKANAKEKEAETQFAFGVGFPYYKWQLNSRYYTVRKAGAILNVVQDEFDTTLGFMRQVCAMFCVEARSGVHYSFNADYPNQFYPLINYVIRPNRWDEDETLVKNGIWQDYEDDYGTDEITQWQWGGFRFLQQMNPDYSTEPPKEWFTKPEFGFVEKTEFCTRAMWSLPRAINVQDSPGLKTFPANNAFDIDDDQGEIKYAYDATTDKGENLYAVVNKGVCLLLTNKSILSDLNGGEIAYMAADTFVKAQYWLNRDTGMFDENWRSAKEAFIPMVMDDGTEVRREALFFANNESVFRFMDNIVTDIGRANYYTKIFNQGIKNVRAGYLTHMASGYNRLYHEYWFYLRDAEQSLDTLFVYSQRTGMWSGTNDFKYDKFTSMGNRIFGHRNLETYELNLGYIINGQPVTYRVLTGAAPEQFWDKEFILTRINSPQTQKPTLVNFYKEVGGVIQCSLDPANINQGVLYMKDYRGFEAQIGRMDVSVSPNRDRLQQRIVLYEILHNLASEFKVIDSSIQYKLIKGR